MGKVIDKSVEVLYDDSTCCELSEKELERLVEEAGKFDVEKASDIDGSELPALCAYMESISCYERLSVQEERALAAAIQRGIAAKCSLEGDLRCISDEKKSELENCVKTGEKAKEKLVTSNLKLAVYAAYRAPWYCGSDIMDIIQDGNEGLIRAAELFDPEKRFRFSTYAMFWIQDAINTAGRKMKCQCNMSYRSFKKMNEVANAVRALEGIGERASTDRVAQFAGVKENDVNRFLILSRYSGIIGTYNDAVAALKNEGCNTLDDELETLVIGGICREKLKEEVDKRLTPYQAKVVDLYYGLSGGTPMTVNDISKKLGISKQGASAARKRAIKILRHPAMMHAFKAYLS